jgi:hypothetical protein
VAASVTNIFDSTALPLLLALEARGIHLELTADGRLLIEPASRLTADEEAALRTHARELAWLLRLCDRGVLERREAFAAQLAHTLRRASRRSCFVRRSPTSRAPVSPAASFCARWSSPGAGAVPWPTGSPAGCPSRRT